MTELYGSKRTTEVVLGASEETGYKSEQIVKIQRLQVYLKCITYLSSILPVNENYNFKLFKVDLVNIYLRSFLLIFARCAQLERMILICRIGRILFFVKYCFFV